jgi:hypothetical protein
MKYLVLILPLLGFFVSSCSDGTIPMPTDPLIELKATHVNGRPLLDGKADDSVWQNAQPFIVHLEKKTETGTDEFNMVFKAVWWSEWSLGRTKWEERPFVGILATWPDNEKNIDKNQWQFDPGTQKWQRSKNNSDWLFLRWFGLSEYNDIWFWDAALTNPMGYAEDEQMLFSVMEDSTIKASLWIDGLSYANDTSTAQNTWDLNYDDNLTPRDSSDDRPKWAWSADINTVPPSVPRIESDGTDRYSLLLRKDAAFLNKTPYAAPTTAVKVPGYVLEDPVENPADIMAAGRWENGQWNVELVRATTTGKTNDIILSPDDRYFTTTFFVAVGNNEKTPYEQDLSKNLFYTRNAVVLNFEFLPPRVGTNQ